MTFSTETSTQLIKLGQDLNQELRLKLSFMPSSTEQEMLRLEAWLEETRKQVEELSNLSLIIFQHLSLLEIELQERLNKMNTSRR